MLDQSRDKVHNQTVWTEGKVLKVLGSAGLQLLKGGQTGECSQKNDQNASCGGTQEAGGWGVAQLFAEG